MSAAELRGRVLELLRAGAPPFKAHAALLCASALGPGVTPGDDAIRGAGVEWLEAVRAIVPAVRENRPTFTVGNPEPYLRRWHLALLPSVGVYLHNFVGDDDPRALHDHPWASLSIMLSGHLLEHLDAGATRELVPGDLVFRRPTHRHRLVLLREAWTLFIVGPVVRSWGFWCPQGFVHWKRYVDPRNKGGIGRGCAQ